VAWESASGFSLRAGERGEFADSKEVRAALEKALNDPGPQVRHVAEVWLKRLEEGPEDEPKRAETREPAS
jgi:hypothetical protein